MRRIQLLDLEAPCHKPSLFQNSFKSYKIPQMMSLLTLNQSENTVCCHLSTRSRVAHSVSLLVIDPSGVRFSVTGNVLGVKEPRSTWAKYFGSSLPVCH